VELGDRRGLCDLRHFMLRNDLSCVVICVTLHDEMIHVRMQYIVG